MAQLPADTSMRLVQSIDDAYEFKRWLGERREIMGLDTETSGLDPWESGAKLRLIQLGDHKTGWAIPWEQWGGVAMEALNNYEGPYTLHNASFDAKWLKIHAGWEMPWHRTDDTLIMAQIENPGGRNGLKDQSVRYVDPRADAGQKDLKDAMKKNGWDFGTVPINFPAYWLYSALDPILAAHLWSHYRTDKTYPQAYDLEMSVRRICTNMEMKGMRVDLDYSQKKFDELTEKVDKAKGWAKKNWGISIGSNPQLAEFFGDKLGASFEKFSATTGAPSVDKNQLGIFSKHPDESISGVAKFILDVRAAEKVSNSYFKNFLLMNHDGIVHPEIKTMGARTGRMSVTNPALQTLPSKDSLVRNAFIPDQEDQLIVSSDYSQIELRLMAHFSRDAGLQQAFKDADATGNDFFVNLGKQAYNDPNFTKEDPRRKLIKGFTYGLLYGAGTSKMAETAKVPEEDMEELAANVNRAYPGIQSFMKEIEREGSRLQKSEGRGYITTNYGRKIPCDRDKAYTLVNFTLQGNAAEIMKASVVRLDAAGFGPYMNMIIHDEAILSMPRDIVKEALPEVANLMSLTNGEYAVDLKAEPDEPVYRWGEKYEKAA